MSNMTDIHLPQRIICTTTESVDILYRLGAGDLIVGVQVSRRGRRKRAASLKSARTPASTSKKSWRFSRTWWSPSPTCRRISRMTGGSRLNRVHA